MPGSLDGQARLSRRTLQILTERSERQSFLPVFAGPRACLAGRVDWDSQVPVGRANHLRQVPNRLRFLSLEALLELLGTLDLSCSRCPCEPPLRPMRGPGETGG
jgi:protein gp37